MEFTTMVFLGLLFAHLLADYPLQGDFLAKMKGSNIIALVSHAGIWTGCIAVAGILMGLNVGLLEIVVLFVVHAVVDYLKAAQKLVYRHMDGLREGLFLDQMIHVAQIIIFMKMCGITFF